jgi:Polyketide cyclase / dehydrase and lipid transport
MLRMTTLRDLTPMRLDELDRAPVQIRGDAHVAATPDAIFEELRDPSLWFPLMRRSAWHTGATSGVGAIRDVDIAMFGTFREHMLAWEPGARVAFAMAATNSPLVEQMAEDWQIARDGDGARVSYLIAVRPVARARVLAPALKLLAGRMFAIGFRRLVKRARWSINLERGTQRA